MSVVMTPRAPAVASGPGGAQALEVHGVRGGRAFAGSDWVAEEVPVALEFNGISHAVMLATPLDLEDFALGFCLSEAILESPGELYGIGRTTTPLGITLELHVAGAAFSRLKQRRRSMAGRTGCGLCGTESLAQVARELPRLGVPVAARRDAIARAMAELPLGQKLQQATGAVHAAAWCSLQGEVLLVREDVGRHNALDKLIGARAASGKPSAHEADFAAPLASHPAADGPEGFFVVTSRASFEMVQKTVMAGVSLLAAVSAPTTMAIETAQRAGLTLVGFARQGDLIAYTFADRVAF